MKIIFSQGNNPRAAGVAFVINKDIAIHRDIVSHEIIPGRALLISIPWHSDMMLTMLNVYAPNNASENENFWADITNAFDTQPIPLPDIMMGDFNMVEDAIDRLPSHGDNAATCKSLFELRSQLSLKDGWRIYNGNEKGYTYLQKPNMIRSRIDRIYSTTKILETAAEWDISAAPMETDHCLTSVKITNPSMPWQGPGRWKLPLFLLKDREFKRDAKKLTEKLDKDISELGSRTQNKNPQLLFKTFKDTIKETATKRAKQTIPKIIKSIILLKQEHGTIINNPTLTEDEKMATAGPIQNRIEQLEKKRFQKAKMTTITRYALEGETVSKYWSNLNKKREPRDPIYSLRRLDTNPTNQPKYEKNSTRMAEIARKYHEDLLTQGLHPDEGEREAAIETVLEEIDDATKLNEPAKNKLGTPIDEDIVKLALKESASGSAPGINGLPYEFWKMLANIEKTKPEE